MISKDFKTEVDVLDDDDGSDEDHIDEAMLRDYLITFRDVGMSPGKKKVVRGLLAVASTFIAIGRERGDLRFVSPLDVVLSVEELESAQGSA